MSNDEVYADPTIIGIQKCLDRLIDHKQRKQMRQKTKICYMGLTHATKEQRAKESRSARLASYKVWKME